MIRYKFFLTVILKRKISLLDNFRTLNGWGGFMLLWIWYWLLSRAQPGRRL